MKYDVLTLYCYNVKTMTTLQKRTTIYFDSAIHRALRIKAAELDRSVSDLVNEAVKLSLAEDAVAQAEAVAAAAFAEADGEDDDEPAEVGAAA